MNETDIFKACGGTALGTGSGTVWDFGFRRSRAESTADAVDPFRETEDVPAITGPKVFLWEYARIANGGKLPPFNWQLTGSCVNGGAQNAAIVRTAVEVVNLARPEVFVIPFTLHAYGYSRHLFGWESEGEGSMGDAMAQALGEVGVTTITDANVPKPKMYASAFCYTEAVEMRFSAWKNCPQPVRDAAKPHPFKYGKVSTLDQAETELRRGRPLTWAGDWGGSMKGTYRGSGENRILWNGDRRDTWNHQESVLGVWQHPEFGRLWYVQNQWYMVQGGEAVSVHGNPANGEPPGGYWIGDAAMEYQCRTGEVRSLKDFSGFTSGLISFGNI